MFDSHASKSKLEMYLPPQPVKEDGITFPSALSYLPVCFYKRIFKEDSSGLAHDRGFEYTGLSNNM